MDEPVRKLVPGEFAKTVCSCIHRDSLYRANPMPLGGKPGVSAFCACPGFGTWDFEFEGAACRLLALAYESTDVANGLPQPLLVFH
jgi:hypothetical protein